MLYDRSGEPDFGVVICDTPDCGRTYARSEDADLLTWAGENELVGCTVQLAAAGPRSDIVDLVETPV